MHAFPFGSPVLPVVQTDRTPKQVFILGVYSSAVHARWIGPDGKTLISALAVASEPSIFWRGNAAEAKEIIGRIPMPPGAGKLVPARGDLNGPSGQALDKRYLEPMGFTRQDAWLCDLLPFSRMNDEQKKALDRAYLPRAAEWGLPPLAFPRYEASELCPPARIDAIAQEIVESRADLLVTLGELPLERFAARFGAKRALRSYGRSADTYGQRHDLTIAGHRLELLPLVHPRQAAGMKGHSPVWMALHQVWQERQRRGPAGQAAAA